MESLNTILSNLDIGALRTVVDRIYIYKNKTDAKIQTTIPIPINALLGSYPPTVHKAKNGEKGLVFYLSESNNLQAVISDNGETLKSINFDNKVNATIEFICNEYGCEIGYDDDNDDTIIYKLTSKEKKYLVANTHQFLECIVHLIYELKC